MSLIRSTAARRPRLFGLVTAAIVAHLGLSSAQSQPPNGTVYHASAVPMALSAPPPPERAPEPAAKPKHPHVWPTCTYVTSEFGPRWGRPHEGIDLGGETGTPVNSVAPGEVVFAGQQRGYGRITLIDHGKGLVSAYAHLDTQEVPVGSTVARGQQIGTLGSSGVATASHLHFETRVNGTPVDPRAHLPQDVSTC